MTLLLFTTLGAELSVSPESPHWEAGSVGASPAWASPSQPLVLLALLLSLSQPPFVLDTSLPLSPQPLFPFVSPFPPLEALPQPPLSPVPLVCCESQP